jgi:hypothetical protein
MMSVRITLNSETATSSSGLPFRASLHDIKTVGDTTWSPLHDEGLIVKGQVGTVKYTLYGQFKYSRDPSVNEAKDYVQEDGSTPGWISNCNELSRGWILSDDIGSGKHQIVCIAASKDVSAVAPAPPKSGTATVAITHHLRQLPDRFTSEFTSTIDPSMIQPKGCGACFVYAFAYAFERNIAVRINNLISKRLQFTFSRQDQGNTFLQLDRRAMLECSYSSEKCKGGYFESLSLDMTVRGIPITSNWNSHDQCPLELLADSLNLYYPHEFLYLNSEEKVKKFILSDGPVLIAVKMTSLSHDQLSQVTPETLLRVERGTQQSNWEYLNHALVITGWGDERNEKFWTVFNPWGKIHRIQRDADWLYKHTLGVTVDVCRGAPHGMLKKELGEEGMKKLGCQSTSDNYLFN